MSAGHEVQRRPQAQQELGADRARAELRVEDLAQRQAGLEVDEVSRQLDGREDRQHAQAQREADGEFSHGQPQEVGQRLRTGTGAARRNVSTGGSLLARRVLQRAWNFLRLSSPSGWRPMRATASRSRAEDGGRTISPSATIRNTRTCRGIFGCPRTGLIASSPLSRVTTSRNDTSHAGEKARSHR